MSDIKRKKGESFEAFIRRVKRQWQRSGVILQAKKVKFQQDDDSSGVKRKKAVRKAKKISKIKYLQKIGKLPPEEDRYNRRRR